MVKHSIFIAALATLIVFVSGMLLQWNLDQRRTGELTDRISELEITTNSLMAEKEIVSLFKDKECEIYKKRIEDIAIRVDTLGKTLENYKDSSLFQDNKYESIKHDYLILEILYWAKLLDLKENCVDNQYVTILYFYVDDCAACDNQGVILTDIKKDYKDKVMIFSLDLGYINMEPNIKFIANLYDIQNTPTIILNKEMKLGGLQSKEKLVTLIDEELKK